MAHKRLMQLLVSLRASSQVKPETLNAVSFIAHKNLGQPSDEEVAHVLRSVIAQSPDLEFEIAFEIELELEQYA